MRVIWVFSAASVLFLGGCGGGGDGDSGQRDTGAPQDTSESPVLALVGDLTLTGEDLRHHMEKSASKEQVDSYLSNPGMVQVALGSLVDQFVWAETARREGIDLSRSERRQVQMMETGLLANKYMLEVIQERVKPPREEVERWYQENQEAYLRPVRVGVRHIRVGTEGEAERIKSLALDGADFGDLAREHSNDETSRDLGGALGFVQTGSKILGMGTNPGFTHAVLAMDEGEIDVLETKAGFHVVKIEKKEGGDLRPLEEVYPTIEKGLLSRRWSEVYNDALGKARDDTQARFLTENFSRFTGVPDTPVRLMGAAKDEPTIRGKIDLYRKIAFDFPDSPFAPEAQFMIGYTNLVHAEDSRLARKAFLRLQEKFPDSEWRKAGDYVLDRLDDPESRAAPEEILERALAGGE